MSAPEISPYIESSETLNYNSEQPRGQNQMSTGNISHSSTKFPFSWEMPSMGVIIAIIILVIIVLVWYFSPKTFESFLVSSERDDLGGDSDYNSDSDSDSEGSLEDDIGKLYKKQKKNLSQ